MVAQILWSDAVSEREALDARVVLPVVASCELLALGENAT